ncbi:hypothetical protein ZWY2020_010626 [Hordeum vulgare]|nr:hypothetical protein ZWY2020_010626 [Hordeum vulgare]
MGKERDTDGKIREQRLKKRIFYCPNLLLRRVGFGFDPITKCQQPLMKKWDELSKNNRSGDTKLSLTMMICMQFMMEESFTQQVLNAAGLNSPSPTLPAPGLKINIMSGVKAYGDDVEVFPVDNT